MARYQWTWVAILGLLMVISGCGDGGGGGGGVSTTTVSGTVFYSGSPVSGKPVYLKNGSGGQTGPVMTGSDGSFTFLNVIPGSYQASCQVATGVTLTCPEVEGQYQTVTLTSGLEFDIGESSPPSPPVDL